ncbi:hypothetical protein IWW54_005751, partial [Coemansia sp. RSA 2705]
ANVLCPPTSLEYCACQRRWSAAPTSANVLRPPTSPVCCNYSYGQASGHIENV